jgi:pimeloyl-ACP methyl ester carboxylesterase
VIAILSAAALALSFAAPVVLEAGAGNSAKTWDDVFEPIARFVHVCAYDRQGLGTSGRTAAPQSGVEAVETLHALLQGHYIQNDEPTLVIEPVRRVVMRAGR